MSKAQGQFTIIDYNTLSNEKYLGNALLQKR